MDWSTRACARSGHVTYRPSELDLATALHISTPQGDAWECLRCGVYVPGEPFAHGTASDAPEVLHGDQVRDRLIIRFLAVERAIRGFLVLILGIVVLQIRVSQQSLQAQLQESVPLLQPFATDIGWNIENSKMLHLLTSLVNSRGSTLTAIGAGLVAYAVLQMVEGTGLWFMQRWAEYLAVVATSAFIPIEIYEIYHGPTVLKVGALIFNIAAVIWLVWTKHLFGANGGWATHHEESLRGRAAIEFALSRPRG